MFREWGFLLTELAGLLLLAGLLGVLVGWLIWGRWGKASRRDTSELSGERRKLSGELQACRDLHAEKDAQIMSLVDELEAQRLATEAAKIEAADARADASSLRLAFGLGEDDDIPERPAAPVRPSRLLAGENDLETRKGSWRYDPDRASPDVGRVVASGAGASAARKPDMLDMPRNGVADDLKRIKGIGRKLEALCNSLGVWHFDQIAAWSEREVAWMDDNLEGFHGRVSRDDWVSQARVLAKGGETEFSRRVKDDDIYGG